MNIERNANGTNVVGHNAVQSRVEARKRRTRGTVLVFVLGILTLLALIGIGLLGSVKAERVRLQLTRPTLTTPPLMDGVIQSVRERLWADMWGNSTTPGYLDGNTNTTGSVESNEPFDAPGPNDRWLASTLPYLVRDGASLLPGFVHPITVNPLPAPKEESIAWPRVSYVGTDVVLNSTAVAPTVVQDFAWPSNSRSGLLNAVMPVYGESQGSFNSYPFDPVVKGVPVILTPPANYGAVVSTPPQPFSSVVNGFTVFGIPGSTTDITIAEARRLWDNFLLLAAWRTTHRFPYFDTNMDGVLDLYDADGDGVPDSPISLVLPYPSQRPNDPRKVYAAVRIVDNASMINVNTASPRVPPDSRASLLTFDEANHPSTTSAWISRDFQRRGRSPADVLLDDATFPVLTAGDAGNRAKFLPGRIYNSTGNFINDWYDPTVGYHNFAEGALIGGVAHDLSGAPLVYKPFDDSDESALRHRGVLPGPERAKYDKSANTADYSTIESALRWTTLWTRRWTGTSYATNTSRWERMAASLAEAGTPSLDLGASPPVQRGWKTLLDEDSPWFIRRSLLTTMSYGSSRVILDNPPPLLTTALVPAGTMRTLYVDPSSGGAPPNWFGEQVRYDLVTSANLREGLDLNRIFLNSAGAPFEPLQEGKAQFLAKLVTAIYLSDIQLGWKDATVAGLHTATGAAPEREDIAWQLAINLWDYIDVDDNPTILIDAAGVIRYIGLEIQPFFSKAYVAYHYDYLGPSQVTATRSAIELLNPFMPNSLPGVSPTIPSTGLPYRVAAGMDVRDVTPAAKWTYQLRIGDPAFPASLVYIPLAPMPTPQIPWDSAAGPGRLVVRDSASVTVAPGAVVQDAPALNFIEDKSLTSFKLRRRVDLIRRYNLGATPPTDWVIDTMDLTQSGGLEDLPATGDGDIDTALERDDVDGATTQLTWKFTIDDADKFSSTVSGPGINTQPNFPRMGESNQNASSNFEPMPWVFRNTGFKRDYGASIDSPAELSRVFAIGTRSALPAGQKPISRQIRENDPSTTPYNDPALGRIDFRDSDGVTGLHQDAKNADKLLRFLTCLGVNTDHFDADSNGIIDDNSTNFGGTPVENSESFKMRYRLPGQINVNTAPLTVLRAVPFMANNGPAGMQQWDCAAGIVAHREQRQVYSAVTNTFAPPSPPPFAGKPAAFFTLGDVLKNVGNSTVNDPFSPRRFGHDNLDLTPHDKTVPASVWSPDFDAKPGEDYAHSAPLLMKDDARERDILLTRWANILTTRSDVFTVYVALIDEDGHYLRRAQFTLDRSVCVNEDAPSNVAAGKHIQKILPAVIGRVETDYYNDQR